MTFFYFQANEDARTLRSLVISHEIEIQGLKEKLRDADHRLREYEEVFITLLNAISRPNQNFCSWTL